MSDPSEPRLALTRVNGAIVVESEEDVRRRLERRKKRASRWGQRDAALPAYAPPPKKKSSILLEPALASPMVAASKAQAAAAKAEAAAAAASAASAPATFLPTMIDAGKMTDSQQQIYLLQMQIQESTMKLARPDLGIPENQRDRSPSPEPVYDTHGQRMNTREVRTRNKLVNQRNNAITRLKVLDPTYQPPASYKYKNTQLEDKVMIPQDEYPHINFTGLLLGPRGNFLEEVKKRTNCNIIIRGKGSLKSGMTGISKDGRKFEALDEPLHAYITAPTVEDVKKGVKEVEELINMQVYNPDCEKAVALRSKHMHDLAVLNGTLRDIDMKCLNCGRLGHKTWQCDDSSIFTASVICNACGGVGHVTSDCRQARPGESFNRKSDANPELIDKEYGHFLRDLHGDSKGADDADKGYVPPMGNLSKCFAKPTRPLMLTNGSGAPGAASAHARAVSSGQQNPGGMLQVMGQSIFGGKLTRLTAGYKSQGELELEREKKKQEYDNRPVPLEWQVERFENSVNKRQEEYFKNLETYVEAEKARPKEKKKLVFSEPPPPPPGAGGPLAAGAGDDGLPQLIGTPLESLKKS